MACPAPPLLPLTSPSCPSPPPRFALLAWVGRRTTAGSGSQQAAASSPERFEVFIGKEDFKFSSSHFVAYDGFRERLHGHNYTCSVRLKGEVRRSEQQPHACLPTTPPTLYILCTCLSSSSSITFCFVWEFEMSVVLSFCFSRCPAPSPIPHPSSPPDQPVSFNSFVFMAGLSIFFEDKMSHVAVSPPPFPARGDVKVASSLSFCGGHNSSIQP